MGVHYEQDGLQRLSNPSGDAVLYEIILLHQYLLECYYI